MRGRLATLYRRLYSAGLVAEWLDFLRAGEELLQRVEHSKTGRPMDEFEYRPRLSESELERQAREAAATGKRPGDCLAELLEAEAARRGA